MGKSYVTLTLLNIMEDEKIHKVFELEQKLKLSNSSVRKYVYELLYFGYDIKSYRGKNGGYRLKKDGKKYYNLDI